MNCEQIATGLGYQEDYGKGHIPRPPIETSLKIGSWAKENQLPIAGLAISITSLAITIGGI